MCCRTRAERRRPPLRTTGRPRRCWSSSRTRRNRRATRRRGCGLRWCDVRQYRTGRRLVHQPKRSPSSGPAPQAALDDLLGSVRAGTYVEPSRAALGEYLRLWLDGLASKGRRPTTIAGYRAKLDKYVFDDPIAAVPLQQVTAEQLDKLYAQMVTGRDGRPLALRTVRHVHQIISTALS